MFNVKIGSRNLEVSLSHDPNYPGICISHNEENIARIEKRGDSLRILTWNGEDEDFHTETIFRFEERPDTMTDCEEDILEMLFQNADFIIPADREDESNYLWDDFDSDEFKKAMGETSAKDNKNPSLYVYSLTEENGSGYITEGFRYVNRIGYYFSKKYIKLPEGGIRYW